MPVPMVLIVAFMCDGREINIVDTDKMLRADRIGFSSDIRYKRRRR
jgi:hypothetical protein